jgi:hypothetical protein
MSEKTIPVSAYFDQLLLTKLEAIAKADDRSLSYVIVQACREMIGRPEQVTKWRQVDIEEQLGRPVSPKGAAVLKRMGARSARVAQRMSKPK